ncbi:MAG: hypothetical protein IJ347_08585 [Faecalibacterium sp.]|nr:hypothetical protein [Faecalibacterium sp.]
MIEYLKDRVQSWYAAEREKLRGMPLKKKIGYLLDYYKGWFIGLLILCLIGFYLGDAYLQSKKEIVLQGFFTNDDWNLFSAEEVTEEYSATLQLQRHQRVVFDDGLYIDLGGQASEYTAASNGKLLAYVTTKELDLVITSREVLEHFTGQLPMRDLKQILPVDLFERLKDQMLTTADENGQIIYYALDMTQSRFVQTSGYAEEDGVKNNYFLFAPKNSLRADQTADFIVYCFSK